MISSLSMINKNDAVIIKSKPMEPPTTRIMTNWEDYRIVKPEEIKTNITLEPIKAAEVETSVTGSVASSQY
jgi:hypothetical protein